MTKTLKQFIGLDLTDAYARTPRPVDVAIVQLNGDCAFTELPPFNTGLSVAEWLSPVSKGTGEGDLLILDGPLGLASSGNSMRDCERTLGAAGKTPDELPIAGSRPFAGYVRGSIELASALVEAGWEVAGDIAQLAKANLLEAYPGSTWFRLAGRQLAHKRTAIGRAERESILRQFGLRFSQAPTTHDQLDAALCALLGWALHVKPGTVTAVGSRPQRSGGALREGLILQPASSVLLDPEPLLVDAHAQEPVPHQKSYQSPRRADRQGSKRLDTAAELPPTVVADWVYFATPARADRWETAELALREGVICRGPFNVRGHLIANVREVKPGDVMLLCFAEHGNCEAIATFRICRPPKPVDRTQAIQEFVDPILVARLGANYKQDPFLRAFAGFLVEPDWVALPGKRVCVVRPGRNAIWRAVPSSATAAPRKP